MPSRCWCEGDLCNNPSNDTFLLSHTTQTPTTTTTVQEVEIGAVQATETTKQTTSKTTKSSSSSNRRRTTGRDEIVKDCLFSTEKPLPYWESRNKMVKPKSGQVGRKVDEAV